MQLSLDVQNKLVAAQHGLMKTKGIVAIFVLAFLLFCGRAICAAGGFDSVRCGSDVGKALLGRTMPNEKVVAVE